MKAILMAAIGAAVFFTACGSNNPPPVVENAGQSCTPATVSQCYPATDGATLMGGAAVCLDRVPDGYCTHFCTADTDCCAVPGECRSAWPQVCAPFESTGMKYCFLSCEDAEIADAGATSADTFCATYAKAGLSCRSTGGGSQNRKVCVP
jgi:hypothetical protein